jgi:hypothetical protein
MMGADGANLHRNGIGIEGLEFRADGANLHRNGARFATCLST